MRTKDFLTWREQVVVAYSSPTVDVLNLRAEGVLCGSFDKDNYTEVFDRDQNIEEL